MKQVDMHHTITVNGKQHTINIDIDELLSCQRNGIEMYYKIQNDLADIRSELQSMYTAEKDVDKKKVIHNLFWNLLRKENKYIRAYKDVFGH